MDEPDFALDWLPGNDVEVALWRALADDDRRLFFEIVRAAPWYLPALPDDPAGARFLTHELLGETYLLVFTSVRSLASTVGPAVSGYTVTGYDELVRRWPVPGWRLGVNPGTPVDAWVTLAALSEAAAGTRVVPTAVPRESAADRSADRALDGYLRRLFEITLLVPATGDPLAYRVVRRDGLVLVDVFTTAEEFAAAQPGGTPYLSATLTDLVVRWPSPEYSLAIDPGSDTALVIPGDQVPGLLLWSGAADDPAAHHPVTGPPPGTDRAAAVDPVASARSRRVAEGGYIDGGGWPAERG